MWLAGCDMTQHCLLPPCAISLEASSPLLTPVSPMPRLAFQLTCSRWAAQWEDTGKGRCVYFPETKCCAAAYGSALKQMAAFDTAAVQPGHLDRQSWLTSGDGEIEKKYQDVHHETHGVSMQAVFFLDLESSFLPCQTSVS